MAIRSALEQDEANPSRELLVPTDLLPTKPFEVLYICTGNICRSPLAEHLMRDALSRRFPGSAVLDWSVNSAGTKAIPGAPMHEHVRAVLEERDVPIEDTPARQATPEMLASADLILTASRRQRAWVVSRQPAAIRRTYTVRQFARLCGAAGGGRNAIVESGEDLAHRATSGRSMVQPVPEADDTIIDPLGRDLGAFRHCADLIEDCIEQMLGPDPSR